MTTPAPTAVSRAVPTVGPWLLVPSPDTSITRALGGKPVLCKKACRIVDRGADRGAACEGSRRCREPGREGFRVLGVADHCPARDQFLLAFACPFHISERNGAMRAGRYHVEEALALHGFCVAVPLKLEFLVIDAARNVGGQDCRCVHGPRPVSSGRGCDAQRCPETGRAQTEERGDAQTEECDWQISSAAAPSAQRNTMQPRGERNELREARGSAKGNSKSRTTRKGPPPAAVRL